MNLFFSIDITLEKIWSDVVKVVSYNGIYIYDILLKKDGLKLHIYVDKK